MHLFFSRFCSLLFLLALAAAPTRAQTKPAPTPKANAKTTPAIKTPMPNTTGKTPLAVSNLRPPATIAPMPRVIAPTKLREVHPLYPWKEKIPTTIFWIGEDPTENNPTPNHKSSWDTNWQANYGGYDNPDPSARNWDFAPKAFHPKLNPFYIALPFNDLTNLEIAKLKIPWYKSKGGTSRKSVCRSQWLALRYGSRVCYAQWEDVGPWETDDHDYVFGNARPKNVENDGAGLDVSPAVRDYLGITSGALCDWRFVEDREVPDGPWCRFGTNNPYVRSETAEQDRIRREFAQLMKAREAYVDSVIRRKSQ